MSTLGNETLGNAIADAVVLAFNNVKTKAGKPTVRLNGVSEWTVLSGLVAIENGQVEVVTLATGVKAMPDEARAYSQGWIVHDMHAEMLSLRLFNWYLVEEIRRASGSGLLEKVGDKYRLRPTVKLALYISEAPCGDASMEEVAGKRVAWDDEKDSMPGEPVAKKQKINRGRAHFDRLGLVRTKPGRADSRITYSKSCLDKLAVKQATGVLNALTSALIDPVFLDYLVLRDASYSKTSFQRCFSRVDAVHSLQVLLYDRDSYAFHKDEVRLPLPLSLLHCVPFKSLQVLQNGVRNGAFKKNRAPLPSGASLVCNQNLYRQAQELLQLEGDSYLAWKRLNTAREQVKAEARAQLDSWPATAADDFLIGS